MNRRVPRASRRDAYKPGIDFEQSRRQRQETAVSLRKSKKDAQLAKRRQNAPVPSATPETTTTKDHTIADIPKFMAVLTNEASPIESLCNVVRAVRRMLSVEKDPPVREIADAGIVKYLVHFLQVTDNTDIVFESAWALTNIASTSLTKIVVESGAVPILIKLLKSMYPNIREQCAWCLGNIAGDNSTFRDSLLHQQILAPLILNMEQPQSMSLLQNVTWSVSNLCRGKPAPELSLVEACVAPLAMLLTNPVVTEEVHVDVVWALSYLSDGPNERIQKVLDAKVTPVLVKFLSNPTSKVLSPTVRCLGNLVTGTDEQTQAVVDAGILKYVGPLLHSSRKAIRKETCWLLSNIAAGTHHQIGALLDAAGVATKLSELALNAPWEVRKEALYSICNIATTGTDTHVNLLIMANGLPSLTAALSAAHFDSKILLLVMEALEKVFEVGRKQARPYEVTFDEYNGIDLLENLQEHSSDDVYKKAIHMLEEFFGAEDVEEDENVAPETDAAGEFTFSNMPKKLFDGSSSADAQTPTQPMFNFGPPMAGAVPAAATTTAPNPFGGHFASNNNAHASVRGWH